MSKLANTLARVLAERLGHAGERFPEGCDERTCFLRLNRYPPCPLSPDAFGLVPHTDSDFLTVLCQDQVGGLQLMKGSRWLAVKPIPNALIVNIGDLFQVRIYLDWMEPRQCVRRRAGAAFPSRGLLCCLLTVPCGCGAAPGAGWPCVGAGSVRAGVAVAGDKQSARDFVLRVVRSGR